MNKSGHLIVNTCISTIALLTKGDILFSLGLLVSASAPDQLEMSYKDPKSYCGYSRRITHRTITHWWPLWCALWFYASQIAILLTSFVTPIDDKNITATISLIQGIALGSLVHILTDSLSPMGVPFLLPFAKYRKRTFLLYSTGKSEWKIIYPLAAFTLSWIIIKNNQFLFTNENWVLLCSSINNLVK